MNLCCLRDLPLASDSFQLTRDGSERFRPIFHIFQIILKKKSGSNNPFGIMLCAHGA
jgi:hypothetical protein